MSWISGLFRGFSGCFQGSFREFQGVSGCFQGVFPYALSGYALWTLSSKPHFPRQSPGLRSVGLDCGSVAGGALGANAPSKRQVTWAALVIALASVLLRESRLQNCSLGKRFQKILH